MSRPLFLQLIFFITLIQSGWGSWIYTYGSTGLAGNFTYEATVTENPADTFSGIAVLTTFSVNGVIALGLTSTKSREFR